MNKNYKWGHETLYKYFIEEGLTESEATYLINKISNSIRQCGDIHCCDNFRFSINGNNEEDYIKIRNLGCCGFYDDTITLKSGKVIKYGFNYGH